jgi:protein-export membrane protein SecD
MNKRSLLYRLILVVAVCGIAFWALYPLKDKINLGLDLQGGIHMVLGANLDKVPYMSMTEDGLKAESLEKLKEIAEKLGLDSKEANRDKLLKEILQTQQDRRRRAVDRALEIIKNRIDEFGVAEPQIQKQGADQIVVQLPGIVDTEKAEEVVSRVAHLEFKLVEADKSYNTGLLEKAVKGEIPANLELEYLVDENTKKTEALLLQREAALTGESLTNAYVSYGRLGLPDVALRFNTRGARIFSRLTGENIGKRLAIVLDGKLYSAPIIKVKIQDGNAIIEGSFTIEEASTLASILRAGALPVPIEILSSMRVGPTLGEDSIRQGLKAAILGSALVILFMAFYYGFSGMIANFAISLCMLLVLGALAGFRATLTLPGIAGLALTVGMGVDANVLIFERIREELAKNKTIRAAVDAGYHRALPAIADSNITTLIAALILFHFGSGPIKGFAVVLSVGILASMFTALVVTRLIFDYLTYVRKIRKLSI